MCIENMCGMYIILRIGFPSKLEHLKPMILGAQNYLLLQVFEVCMILLFGVHWKPFCAAFIGFIDLCGKILVQRKI